MANPETSPEPNKTLGAEQAIGVTVQEAPAAEVSEVCNETAAKSVGATALNSGPYYPNNCRSRGDNLLARL